MNLRIIVFFMLTGPLRQRLRQLRTRRLGLESVLPQMASFFEDEKPQRERPKEGGYLFLVDACFFEDEKAPAGAP